MWPSSNNEEIYTYVSRGLLELCRDPGIFKDARTEMLVKPINLERMNGPLSQKRYFFHVTY